MSKRISCRTHHGGVFTVTAKRGRPPVRCTEENPCTASGARKPTREEVSAKVLAANEKARKRQAKPTKKDLAAERALLEAKDNASRTEQKVKGAPTPQEGMNGRQLSLQQAQKAKAQLVEQGWEVKGEAKGDTVTVTGHRGEELICLTWREGVLVSQEYSLWSVDKASRNGMVPPHSLPFDPEWVSDRELAAHIVGNKITWWNRISGKEEHGTCGKDTVAIEHRFDGAGHEIPSERLIKFNMDGTGNMRLVQLGQLLKIGK